jgi:hypothetical protein
VAVLRNHRTASMQAAGTKCCAMQPPFVLRHTYAHTPTPRISFVITICNYICEIVYGAQRGRTQGGVLALAEVASIQL